MRDYNDRLLNGLVIASLAFILLFRFVIKSSLLETLGWLAFAFLQVGPSFKQGGLRPATAPCLPPNHHSALCRRCLSTACMVITQAALISKALPFLWLAFKCSKHLRRSWLHLAVLAWLELIMLAGVSQDVSEGRHHV